MSSIKLAPNASGTGEFTIAAPNSNTNRTFNLPDESGTVLVNGTNSNVGIGTSSPSNFGGVNLQVQNSNIGSILWSNGTFTGQLLASASAEVTVGSRSNHPLRFGTNDTERMRIDTSGNVGIGTSSPSTLLHTSGTVTSNVATGNVAGYVMSVNGTATGFLGSSASGTTLDSRGATFLSFQTNSSERARIDSSGNVGIGTSSPAGYRLRVVGPSGSPQFRAGTESGSYLEMNGFDSNPFYCVVGGSSVTAGVFGTQANIPALFFTNNTERARISADGNFLYRCTAVPNVSLGQTGFSVTQNEMVFSSDTGTTISYWRTSSGAGRFALSFWNGTSNVGNIALNTTSTTYNTSSDYRLKHDIAPMTGALSRVATLKPCTYKWNVDNSEGEGFIAHELAEVCPQAVTGEKDAVDADGNPVYQGIDTSFLVATLTAAIQEQQAMIQTLTARIEALEAK